MSKENREYKEQNNFFVRKNICLSLLVMIVAFISSISLLSTQINAATFSNISKTEGKQGAMKYLKGTWKNVHSSTESTVTFTKKYAKYYVKEIGRPAYVKKCRIVSINKIKNKKGKLKGYFIKMKDGQQKIAYRLYLNDPDILPYFFSWSEKNIWKYYSGGGSLIKSGKKDKTAYYSATSYKYAQLTGRKDFISKISYKGNKVTIKGALMKAHAFGQNSILLKNGSRTFKMTKYCEYYYMDGKGGDDFGWYGKKISKKKYFKTINENDFFVGGVYIYANSKGEIYRMIVDYSM